MRKTCLAVSLCLFSAAGALADRYVAPGGAGGGTSWADPYGSVQTAIDAWTAGETVFVRYGTYTNASQLVISNKAGIVVSGGWAGSGGSPGDLTNAPTIFKPATTQMRILYGYGSTATVERVTMQGASYSHTVNDANHVYGIGMYWVSCVATVRACVVNNNVMPNSWSDRYDHDDGGAGIAANGGQLTILNSTISSNSVTGLMKGLYKGGGLRCVNTALTVTNTFFDGNSLSSQHGEQATGSGAGAYLSGGSASILGCAFTNNSAYGQQSATSGGFGGGLYATALTSLSVDSSVFSRNRAYGTASASTLSQGGAMFLTGAGMPTRVVGCSILDSTGTLVTAAVYMDSGAVALTNDLVAKSVANGIQCAGGTATLVNCTLATNLQYGAYNSSGKMSIKNSIVWNNVAGQLFNATTTTYSDVRGPMVSGTGNMNVDPLFVNAAGYDYHLKSTKGSWHNGAWTADAANSPCIDMADPADGIGSEPAPNGGRINMGAFGGTSQASLTPDPPGSVNLPAVNNLGASGIRRTSARLSGQVTDPGWPGGYCTTWFNYRAEGSATTNVLPMNLQNGTFYTDVAGLTPGTLYHVTILASNSAGSVTSGETTFTSLANTPVAWYVAPTGSGVDGTNWTTAFTTIEAALPLCTVAGDTVYVKCGAWSRTIPLILSNCPPVVIKGGYAGNEVGGLPGDVSTTNTVLSRDGSVANMRLFVAYGCTATLERVTMQGGYWSINALGTGYGAGAYVDKADLTLTQCTLNDNRMVDDTDNATPGYGGGMYVTGGRLVLNASTLTTNRAEWTFGNHTYLYGGAIYAVNSTVIASNGTLFAGDYISAYAGTGEHGFGEGGALWLSGGTGLVTGCTFSNNYTYSRFNGDSVGESVGGAIYATNVSSLVLDSNLFVRNYGYAYFGGPVVAPRGGTIYLTGAAGSTRIQGCQMLTNRAAQTYVDGSVWLAAGTLAMTNNLLARNAGDGVTCGGGTARVVNCTLAYNTGYGVRTNGGSAMVRNSIAWGNTGGGVLAGSVTYSDAPGLSAVGGNLNADPSFVNAAANDFHELSKAGSWHNDVGNWVTDTVHSVCIDAGDPGDPVGAEPDPNGGIVNMGAYGGTAFASKHWEAPKATEPPVMDCLPPGFVRRENARFVGQVVDSKEVGSVYCTAWFYWWAEGSGPTNVIPMGLQTGVFSNDVSGLTGGITYHYRVLGSNSFGAAWSAAESVFTTLSAGPVNWYVALDGTGVGTNWTTAFPTIAGALGQCSVSGDTIVMKYGTYTNPVLATLVLSNHLPIAFMGGFAGIGTPGATTNLATVITRDPSQNARVVYGFGTTATFVNVTIWNGLTTAFGHSDPNNPLAWGFGGGLYLNACDLTMSNCVVVSNTLAKTWDYGKGYGGGIFVTNGTLRLVNCLIASNRMSVTGNGGGGNHTWGYGGGVYAANARVTASNCTFLANEMFAHCADGEESYGFGGALCLTGGSASIAQCTFSNNWVGADQGLGGSAQGGVIWAGALTTLDVDNARLQGNYGLSANYSPALRGGLIYLDGPAMTTRLTSCLMYTNTTSQIYAGGDIWLNAGTLGMTNVLLAKSASNAVMCVTGTVNIINCTVSEHAGVGVSNAAATVSMRNAIVWGNAAGGVGGAATINYSDVQGGVPAGSGNISADPLFVYAAGGDYHEKGTGGAWSNGVWTRYPVDSPCIDKGDPASAFDLEPYPNGRRINMGAYGNTPQASKKYVAQGGLFIIY